MTTNHHTPIATGAAANASTFNAPLAQLDAAIDTSLAPSAATTLEVVNARDGWPTLLDHLDAIVLTGNGTDDGLPLTAGSGQALTGTLYIDPGADDAAQLLRVPTTSTNNGDILFNVYRAEFETVEDVVFNWGFNNAVAGGKIDAALHAWYLQLENDYKFAGKRWTEYHLNLFPAAGGSFRPFQYTYTTDGTEGSIVFRASDVAIMDIPGVNTLITMNPGSPGYIQMNGQLVFRPPVNNASGLQIATISGVTLLGFNTSTDSASSLASDWQFRDPGDNALVMNIMSASKKVAIGGANQLYGVLTSQSTAANLAAGSFHAHASQSELAFQVLTSAHAVMFGVGATGQITTNQASADTNSPSGATAYKLPIYGANSVLLGYVPIYASAW